MASVISAKDSNYPPNKKKLYEKKIIEVYSKALLTKEIAISMKAVVKDLKSKLERKIKQLTEGKCIPEGYVKPQSIKILTYSSGRLTEGDNIYFEVVYECDICLPVEGMLMEAVTKNVTKAGIRAEIIREDITESPVVIFLARDHHYNMDYFSTIKENDSIKIRVIGIRYELNDKYISVIAELIEPKKQKKYNKPRLVLKSD